VKVAFVAWRDLDNPNAGGSEVVVDRLIRGLQARGHEGVLVCGGPVGDRPYEVIVNGGTYTQYLTAPFATRRLRDVDLLVDVANGMSFFAPLWWRGPVLFLVHHVQGEMWHHFYFPKPVAHFGQWLEGSGQPMVYRNCAVVAVSESTRTELVNLGFTRDRIGLMHNGLDESAFVGPGEQPTPKAPEPQFLALSRLAPHKAVDRLLDLWAQVQPITGGRFVIAGDGPEAERLQARHQPGVEFVGRIDEAAKRSLLGSSWLLVHAARREGWGLVVMEAAAQGTPSLTYDVMGLRDSIVDGVTGRRVPDDEAFVKAWINLTEDHAERARLGEAARVRAETFTWDRTVDQFLLAAQRALATGRGRRRRTAPAVIDLRDAPAGEPVAVPAAPVVTADPAGRTL
jgi:glycosyltransferase involved in cell wall biosynthesis